jgi:hypothetical protein
VADPRTEVMRHFILLLDFFDGDERGRAAIDALALDFDVALALDLSRSIFD